MLNNRDNVKGFVLTHGHEDHIGALPYIFKQLNVPVYGLKLTLELVKSKLEEHKMLSDCTLTEVKPGEQVKTDHFKIQFIRTCHSIADACALAIQTPEGTIVHTGDFKIDYTSLDGEIINLQHFAKLGQHKC